MEKDSERNAILVCGEGYLVKVIRKSITEVTVDIKAEFEVI